MHARCQPDLSLSWMLSPPVQGVICVKAFGRLDKKRNRVNFNPSLYSDVAGQHSCPVHGQTKMGLFSIKSSEEGVQYSNDLILQRAHSYVIDNIQNILDKYSSPCLEMHKM